MVSKLSFLVITVAVVPCLLAADGLFSALFPSRLSSQKHHPLLFKHEALPSKSGYLSLHPSSRARMFYAFYEAAQPKTSLSETPIVLWLQGGPGCSSMTGNFYEFGPWRISPGLGLQRNEYSWNTRFGFLFIDNPVGSGYSIAEADEDIPTNQEQVATHLYTALSSFFQQVEPGFGARPFFIAGESYAGKYVPALGYYVMKRMGRIGTRGDRVLEEEMGIVGALEQPVPFRLDGLIIGNGLTDPEVQVQTHADTAYNFGLIDQSQKAHVEDLAREVVEFIKREDWHQAYKARTELMDWIINASGLATPLDVRRSVPYHCAPDGKEFLAPFLNQKAVKNALHAEEGAHWVPCNPRVRRIMANDTMKSVKWMVEELLQTKVPILLFQGQYDIKDGVASSEAWMRALGWEGTESFFSNERAIWRVGRAVAGYWRSYGTLTHVVVLGAGHQVPADQGLHSQQMLEIWIGQQLSPYIHGRLS